MTWTQAQERLWHALELGPHWIDRPADAAQPPVRDDARDPAVAGAAWPQTAALPGDGARDPEAAPGAGRAVADLDWQALASAVRDCRACDLCQTRRQTVFAAGDPEARWLLVGEAPGADEDAQGEPFVGQAGKLLDNMLAAAGLGRKASDPGHSVCIVNVLKCRPPGNRNPEPSEVSRCAPFLRRQLELVAPRIVIALGRFAAQTLLQTDASIGALRGRVHHIDVASRQVPLVVTYHPAYLLRTPSDKSRVWEDLCLALETERVVAPDA